MASELHLASSVEPELSLLVDVDAGDAPSAYLGFQTKVVVAMAALIGVAGTVWCMHGQSPSQISSQVHQLWDNYHGGYDQHGGVYRGGVYGNDAYRGDVYRGNAYQDRAYGGEQQQQCDCGWANGDSCYTMNSDNTQCFDFCCHSNRQGGWSQSRGSGVGYGNSYGYGTRDHELHRMEEHHTVKHHHKRYKNGSSSTTYSMVVIAMMMSIAMGM